MLIAATTVNKGVSKAKEVISENKYTIMGTIGTIGALGVAYFAFDRWKKKKDEQEANSAYGVDSKEGQAVRIATTIYNSLHTWGNPVFTFMSNTDEESIKGALKLMKLRGIPFSLVTAMYKKLYDRSLSTDLSKELDVDEKKEIDSIIYLKPSPVIISTDKSTATYAKVNSWNGEPLFKTVSDVYLPGFAYGREKIIHLKNDTYLGPLTGKQYKGFKQVSVMI
ncbi:hypothetical protein [Flammeovirga sp. SJP92]|uniref:hypothetical protein n=1 Tax=Flammeovirga sp. SJP92 TaxID=1775430 RepID=UPI0007879F25|nr:hypothetical protein [Flammeovirga sp. SJP92]KXX67434.1 hypothetical protein AVL50_26855 [Flammeovirga sp. SJP92]